MKRQFLKILLAGAASALLAACGSGHDATPTAHTRNIVEVAKAAPDLSILVEAVVAADLAGTLSGAGPFTVFAPTNAAFAAALKELGLSKAELLAPENKALLSKILTYHVVSGKVLKQNIPFNAPISTVQGDTFTIGTNFAITDQKARLSSIVATDIEAVNGVVHLVDKVILPKTLPPAVKTIVGVASDTADLSILVEAVVAADLAATLSSAGPFTVFAPTNAAFAAALSELGITKDALFADKALLTKILTYHVLSGKVLKANVPAGSPITTVQGETFTISSALAITDQRARVANITATDIQATNGVVHLIDKVILPKP